MHDVCTVSRKKELTRRRAELLRYKRGFITTRLCKARYWDCMLSVRLYITLVDHNNIGWKSWKLIARQLAQHLRSS